MVTYTRTPSKNNQGEDCFRYFKNGTMVKESRVPHEVMEKFQDIGYADTIEYDDAPERRRCAFCDAPQKRQRVLDSELIDLCEYDYQNKTLGAIAAQVKLLKQEEKRNGIKAAAHKGLKTKRVKRANRKNSVALNYTGN
jgi:hypothetical protein